jgi:DNA gyrase subunit A
MQIIKDELSEILEKYGDERRTEIVFSAEDFRIEDIIADEPVVVTISHLGYIKRTQLQEYRQQSRGGVGSRGSATRDEDFLEHLFIADTHAYMLFFTERGRCFWLRVFEIPEGGKATKGRPIQNLIQIEQGDRVKAFIAVKGLDNKEYTESNFIVMCTKKGIIKKTTLGAYSRPRSSGINAISVREDDELLEAKLTDGSHELMMALKSGRAIRFPEEKVRPMGRTATGVRGIRLANETTDEVVGLITVDPKDPAEVLVVSEKGFGKRSNLDEYRITNRGGKGVRTINVTEKTGALIALKAVVDGDHLMIITMKGTLIRMAVEEMRVMGRATQGVRLINLKNGDEIAAVARVKKEAVDESETTDVTDETDPSGESNLSPDAPTNE